MVLFYPKTNIKNLYKPKENREEIFANYVIRNSYNSTMKKTKCNFKMSKVYKYIFL